MKTLGGRQFWGDVQFFHGWRIQQNVFTHHFRLLDEFDHRHASGSLETCQETLWKIREQRQLPEMSGRGVVCLHGITRSSKSFTKMEKRLRESEYSCFSFNYPSTRVSIRKSSEYLQSVIDSLEGIEEINFVVHSMGGLVVRAYLDGDRDSRLNRMVMIGVPNDGAQLASLLKQNFLFRTIMGPARTTIGL